MSYRRYPSAATNGAIGLNGQPIPDQSQLVAGSDGVNLIPLAVDSSGNLQVEVGSLPSGLATEAKQDTGNTSLSSIDGKTPALVSGRVPVDGSGVTQPVSGSLDRLWALDSSTDSVTVAGTIVASNPSVSATGTAVPADATMIGGSDGTNLRAIKTDSSGVVEVSASSLPLPTGAATETTLANIYTEAGYISNGVIAIDAATASIDGKLPAKTAAGNLASEIVQIDGTEDTGNSSTTPLGISGVFTGSWKDATNFASIQVGIYADQNSATDGVEIQFSKDGTNVDHVHNYTYAASSNGNGYLFQPEFKYYRVKYTNSTVAQTRFALITTIRPMTLFPSQYRVAKPFTDETQALYTHGVITGKSTAGSTYVDVKVNPSGALTVEADVTSSVLPTGAATESTLSTLNGKVTACNTGAVTVSSSVLPTGAATEATLSAASGKLPATLGQKTMANSMAVVIASDQSSVPTKTSNSKGEFVRNDYSSASVTTSAYTQLIASTAAAYSAIEIFDSSGQTLKIAIGGAGSEIDQFLVFPGGNGWIPFSVASGSRISIKAVSANATSGEISLNLYV